MKEHGIIEITSQAVLLCARAGYDSHGKRFLSSSCRLAGLLTVPDQCLELLVGCCTVALSAQSRRGKNTLFKVLQSATRAEWYPTLKELEVIRYRSGHSPELKQLMEMWSDLGARTLLDKNVERQRYEKGTKERAKFCSWKQCQFHTQKPSAPLRTCVGCGETRYCDRTCQAKSVYAVSD
ncbi:hypothetical protein OF83DRAFT_247473 [Amylostereum chailletii]|nr:hypothetical protein OF83DRAFT_247473 [Amylostereum chailletii]